MTDIITENQEMSTSSKQQKLLQMKQKTISRHFDKVIQYFRKEQNEWTRLNVAKFMINIAFWMPIYILFGYLTIGSSIAIIQQYQVNPIYLNMTAMINQPRAIFPNYTICLYFNVTQVFDAVDTMNRNGSNSSYSEDLKAFFFDNGETLTNDTSNLTFWPTTTNGVIVRYLIMMYEFEALRDPAEQQFDFQQFLQGNDGYWTAVRNVLVPKIAEYNISIEQLKATFHTTLSSDNYYYCIFSLFLKKESFSVPIGMPSNHISFIGRDSFCFRLHSDDFQMGTTSYGGDGTSYSIYINGTVGKGENVLRWPLSLDFTGRSTPPPQSQYSV
jgi:hypothetical protein